MHDRVYRFAANATALTVLCFSPFTVLPQELKTLQPQGGGMITYGQVAGQKTEAGAMGYILHNLHQQFGERPEVGKLFDVRGTQSVAIFFSLTRHDQASRKNPLPIGGMIIATKVATDHVEAAVLSDEVSRFHKTLGPNLKTLFAQWRPFASASVGAGAPVAQLHQVTLPDRSATVSIPDGWQIASRMSGMGTIVAGGPHDQVAELGTAFLMEDIRNPAVQQTYATVQRGGLQGTAYAKVVYVPWGQSLPKAFVLAINNIRRQANLPQATYNFASTEPVAGPMTRTGQATCVHLTGTADLGNGKELQDVNGLFCEQPPGPHGAFLAVSYTTMTPVSHAAQDRPTLGAIFESFQVDMRIVNQQADQIAAPAIEQIHAIGRAAEARIQAAHQAQEIHDSSVYQHWDNMDKRSQEFENYQLGYSVIGATDNQYHGTFWNEDADALVKSHPDKFEYVNAPNYWKGIDY